MKSGFPSYLSPKFRYRRVLFPVLELSAPSGVLGRVTVELFSDNSFFFDLFGEDELLA